LREGGKEGKKKIGFMPFRHHAPIFGRTIMKGNQTLGKAESYYLSIGKDRFYRGGGRTITCCTKKVLKSLEAHR